MRGSGSRRMGADQSGSGFDEPEARAPRARGADPNGQACDQPAVPRRNTIYMLPFFRTPLLELMAK
jgi:hypothetical protein